MHATRLNTPLMLPLFIILSTLTAVAARACSSLQPSHPPSNNFQFNWTSTCPLPTNVWSWGLSLSCCDVFPRTWGQNKRADLVGEHGVDIDWATVPIGKAAIVYVPSWDIGSFLARFATLPRSHRISVVSGGEDVGLPREAFGLGKRDAVKLGALPLTLEAFLSDERLVAWHVQNYDLGCNPHSGCTQPALSPLLARKVHPLPIGIGFHCSFCTEPTPPCTLQQRLNGVARAALPFQQRKPTLLAPFRADRDGRASVLETLMKCGGGQSLSFLNASGQLTLEPESSSSSKKHASSWRERAGAALGGSARVHRFSYWRALASAAFVASPFGRGIDTHRAWEVLALGSVPVMLSSSLDPLFDGLPVVLLESWSDACVPGAVDRWRERITKDFGPDPFASVNVRERLSTKWWVDKIRGTHKASVCSTGDASPQPQYSEQHSEEPVPDAAAARCVPRSRSLGRQTAPPPRGKTSSWTRSLPQDRW